MELKLFTDLIDALGKVAVGLKVIVNLPKAGGKRCPGRWTTPVACSTPHSTW